MNNKSNITILPIKQNLYKIIFILFSLLIFIHSVHSIYYRAEKISIFEVEMLAIPALIIFAILIISFLSQKKFPKATPIIVSVLSTLFLFLQIAWSIIIVDFAGVAKITDINKYEKALSLTYRPDYIKHFPKLIPPHAKNTELYKSPDNIFGSESIYLKFDTDRAFIDQELSKYKYQREFCPKDNAEIEDPLFFHIDCHECRYHIIQQMSGEHNIYGIAEKENTIIYFYLNP